MQIQLQNIQLDYLSNKNTSEVWGGDVTIDSSNNTLIIAPSGTGKTSLFKLLLGKLKPTGGVLSFDGKEGKTLSDDALIELRKNKLSFVFQGLRLFDDLSALENVSIKNQLTKHKSDEEVLKLFQHFGLEAVKDKPIRLLSWGEKQRVAIIRSLCQPFEFLILDEPFSHLDEGNVQKIKAKIEDELLANNAGLVLFSLGDDYGFSWNQTIHM